MTTHELTREQIIKLKQDYLMFHDDKEHSVSWGELANADELVTDETIHENYGYITFAEEDF